MPICSCPGQIGPVRWHNIQNPGTKKHFQTKLSSCNLVSCKITFKKQTGIESKTNSLISSAPRCRPRRPRRRCRTTRRWDIAAEEGGRTWCPRQCRSRAWPQPAPCCKCKKRLGLFSNLLVRIPFPISRFYSQVPREGLSQPCTLYKTDLHRNKDMKDKNWQNLISLRYHERCEITAFPSVSLLTNDIAGYPKEETL